MVVGIEKIWVDPGTLALPLRELAIARGRAPDYPETELLCSERTVLPPWEDPVSMAINAAEPMLTDEDRAQIELAIVATESAVDFGKAMSTYLHEHCRLPADCRCFEVKQACYGGAAALFTAAHWIRSRNRAGKKALVVCTDQSRVHFGRPWEFVMGAGAVAMLVSAEPHVLALDLDTTGSYGANVHDTFRPAAQLEVGNADLSLHCYLDALEGAFGSFLARAEGFDLERDVARSVYHVPFGGMTKMAHRALLRQAGLSLSGKEAQAHFERTVRPGLRFNARMGGTYTAALFVALAGTLASGGVRPGDALGLFAYGSGSSAEYFRGFVGERAIERVEAMGLERALDARRRLSLAEYEALEGRRAETTETAPLSPDRSILPGHFEAAYAGRGRVVLEGVDEGWVRHYARA